MIKFLPKIFFIVFFALPLTILANGSLTSTKHYIKSQSSAKENAACDKYPEFKPFYSSHIYKSGVYVGVQGSYLFTMDFAEFQGSNPSNPSYESQKKTNHLDSNGGGVYLGYGYVINRDFLPYLGMELALNLRSKYNSHDASFESGDIYGKQINSRVGLSFDIMPGFFFDDSQTTLIYVRLGLEGDQLQIDSDTHDIDRDYAYQPAVRIGAGIEHVLMDHFYLRADYAFSAMLDSVDYTPYLPTYNDSYSSKVYFNTFSLGLSYRF